MKEHIRITLALSIIVIISTLLLSLANQLTKDVIEQNRIKELDSVSKELFPEADSFTQMDGYKEYYQGSILIGYSAEGTARGYSSEIKVVVGFGTDKKISKLVVVEQEETPGLGGKIEEKSFLEQFFGLDPQSLKISREGGQIDAVTGATISSNAALTAVKDAFSKIENE